MENIILIIGLIFILFFVRLFFKRFDNVFKNTERIKELEIQNNEILSELKELKEILKQKS
ncbi:hypothetical protein [Algoriella sp.]|uniref:hypothetical protein n=1 Tax=Algoriella sp. TaxID=1872434 RepID=UPI002FC827E7